MGILPPSPPIASAYPVHFGNYRDVTRLARQRGIGRQWLYRDAPGGATTLHDANRRAKDPRLHPPIHALQQDNGALRQGLHQAVVLDAHKQAEFATLGQARGISLTDLHALLETLAPGQAARIATLGRWTQKAGRQEGLLLEVLDGWSRPCVRQAVADEI